MNLVVKLLRVGQRQIVLHRRLVAHAHEVVVPRTLRRNHEKSKETIGEKHLNFFVVAGKVTLGVVAFVGVVLAPLETTRSQFVGGQRAGAGSERTERKSDIQFQFFQNSFLALSGGGLERSVELEKDLKRNIFSLITNNKN